MPQQQSASSPTTTTTPQVLLLRCVLCRKPVEISSSSSNNSNNNSNNNKTTADLLYACAEATSQDFPLCQQCWHHRHVSTQQTSLSELSSLVETLNSVDSVNPTAIAVFQDISLQVDPCSNEYVAVEKQQKSSSSSSKKKNKKNIISSGTTTNKELFGNNNSCEDETNNNRKGKHSSTNEIEEEFIAEKAKLLSELANLEKKLITKRSEVLSLQEDLTVFRQEEDGIDRKQNGLVNQEAAVKSAAQSAASRLHTAKAGFARLGLSAAEGAALVEATFKNSSSDSSATAATPPPKNNNNDNTNTRSSGSSASNNNNNNDNTTIFANISSLGSCLGAAYQLDVDDTIPRINGRRVGRLPHYSVTDEEINCGCGFLSLLMHHFLQSYTKMEKTGCSMEPLGCQSTITVFVPKKVTVDFYIKRKFFSWSTFGQAWVVFANCTNEVVISMVSALRVRAQKLRSNASFVPGSNSPTAILVNRIDDHITSAQSSLPKISAGTGNPAAKVDDNNVKYGDASDTMWTAGVHGLFRCLKWCIEAEKFLAE